SPSRIASDTPKSTWLAPYAVSRFCTSSSNFFSQVRLAHRRVGADRPRLSGRDQAAVHQYGNAVGEPEHGVHVVLDEQHRPVRARPAFTRAWVGSAVTSDWLKRMRPESVPRLPEIWLIRVVLPAPFGPMSACTSPRATCSVTSSVATTPPKRLDTPRSSSMALCPE